MRDFIVTPIAEQDEESEWNIVLPIHRKLAIQAQQSKKRQALYNKESWADQTKVMHQKAIRGGWSDEDIIMLIENKRKDGKLVDASGTLRIDQRPTMQDLWGYIERDEIGAVMTRAVDRLFRHINMIEPAQFAEHCKKHGVIILTEKQRFDFNKRPEDTKRFLAEAQAGADYISGHIAMMGKYKREKALRGEYDGRNVPVGFILDEDRMYFVIYEPHAHIVVWIFRRFRELSGNAAALYKEIAALPYLFPFFPDGMNQSMALGNNGQGYTITPRGLRDMLCNVSYIGWWLVYDCVEKTVIRADGIREKVLDKVIYVFAVTLKMALIGTLACLVIGYPLAYFLATRAGRYKTVLLLLIIVPFWTSFLIRTYAWETILDSQGVLSNVLQAIGVIHQPLQILYSPVAIFIGIVYNYLPLMVFPLYVALERMDKRLVEASKDLGAGRFATFRQVTLPLTLPGVMTGCLLVFIPLTGEYLIPTILGGSKNIFMGSLIANQFLEVRDWPFGAALGVMVMVLLLVLVNIYLMVFRRVQSVPGL